MENFPPEPSNVHRGRPKQNGVRTCDLPPREPAHDLQKLQTGHQEILRLLTAGMKPADIAREQGCVVATVLNLRKSTLGKEKLNELSADRDTHAMEMAQTLQHMSDYAIGVLDELLQPDIAPNIRFAASKDVMDRAGYGAVTRSLNMSTVVTSDDIEAVKRRVAELAEKEIKETIVEKES